MSYESGRNRGRSCAMRVNLEKLRELRRKARLTQADMAAALGYRSSAGYFYLEHGRSRMTVEQWAMISHILGVEPGELLISEALRAEEVSVS